VEGRAVARVGERRGCAEVEPGAGGPRLRRRLAALDARALQAERLEHGRAHARRQRHDGHEHREEHGDGLRGRRPPQRGERPPRRAPRGPGRGR
jgi:hypothetical protein